MKTDDFRFIRKDTSDFYEDYWFEVLGESRNELLQKYYEYGMVDVTSVVYSKTDGIVGVRRQFPFNYDVITPDDKELKDILKKLV